MLTSVLKRFELSTFKQVLARGKMASSGDQAIVAKGQPATRQGPTRQAEQPASRGENGEAPEIRPRQQREPRLEQFRFLIFDGRQSDRRSRIIICNEQPSGA